MTDIFAEVDEAIKQERLEKIWADYKFYIIGSIVSIVLLTAIMSGYNAWNDSVKEKQTAELSVLLDAPDFPANVNLQNLSLSGDVRAIALMSAGAALLSEEEKDLEKVALFYSAVVEDENVSEYLRNLSSLMVGRILADADNVAAQAVLKKLYDNENSLWRYHAALELAVLSAHQDVADYPKAQEYLNMVSEAVLVPAGLKERARSLQHVYMIRQEQSEQK